MTGPSHACTSAAASKSEPPDPPWRVGPILHFRGRSEDGLELSALLIRPVGELPLVVTEGDVPIAAEVLDCRCGHAVLRYMFSIPVAGGPYTVDGETYGVAGVPDGDLRIAYASCNGMERGDHSRVHAERNTMWERLVQQHKQQPLNLLLHGGDQFYADEVLDVHPAVQAWAGDSEAAEGVDQKSMLGISELIHDFYFTRYVQLYRQPSPAWLLLAFRRCACGTIMTFAMVGVRIQGREWILRSGR